MVVPIQYQLKDDGQPLLLKGDGSSDLFGYCFFVIHFWVLTLDGEFLYHLVLHLNTV